jgi:oligoendopeptidase F
MEDVYVKSVNDRVPTNTWDLTNVFPNDDAWTGQSRSLPQASPHAFQGSSPESPVKLLECIDMASLLRKRMRTALRATPVWSDLDARRQVSRNGSKWGRLPPDLSALDSFIDPEILRIGENTIAQFIRKEPRLAVYRHIFDDILRRRDHTRSEGEEKIIAEANLMADSPVSINNIFTNADFPYPEIQLGEGTTVRLDPAAFSLHRRSSNRENRRKVFASYLGKLNEFRRTIGAQLAAEVRKNMFFTRARTYGSCLERALDGNNIPISVYNSLIAGAHAHFDTLHRYLQLRKMLLGLKELHYYDLYAPIVKELELNYSFDEAVDHVLASLAPLGPDYLETARKALSNRWIDVYHNHGKRSGAYSNGSVYDVHPYIS